MSVFINGMQTLSAIKNVWIDVLLGIQKARLCFSRYFETLKGIPAGLDYELLGTIA